MAALRAGVTVDAFTTWSQDRLRGSWTNCSVWSISSVRARHRRRSRPRAPLDRQARGHLAIDQIASLLGRSEQSVHDERRWDCGMTPVYKMVDTCAGEFEASTPYFYSTYEDEDEATRSRRRARARRRLRPDPHRAGHRVRLLLGACRLRALHDAGVASIMINSNPETVSTDFDASDRLYFEPLTRRASIRVIEHERATAMARVPPVIVQFGGQTAINLAEPLTDAWC